MTTGKKAISITVLVIFLIVGVIVYYRYFFVFGEGVKAGELNYIVKKGYLFKTYEGKLIQTGLRSQAGGSIQSNEFEFSVSEKAVAEKMMANSGKTFELHYKEYKNPVAWRGFSVYIVDEIISVKESQR